MTAAILAGGTSRRMGRDKAWLEIGDGTPLIRRVATALAQVTSDLIVVGGDERCAELGYPVVAGKRQTMHAVYRRTCLPAVGATLSRGDLRVIAFFPEVRMRAVGIEEIQSIDPELRALIDLDTPDELADARRAFRHARTVSHERF